jgi:hypothetical protein
VCNADECVLAAEVPGLRRKRKQRELELREADAAWLVRCENKDDANVDAACKQQRAEADKLQAEIGALPEHEFEHDRLLIRLAANRPLLVASPINNGEKALVVYLGPDMGVHETVVDGRLRSDVCDQPFALPDNWSAEALAVHGGFVYATHATEALLARFDFDGRSRQILPAPAPLMRLRVDPDTGRFFGLQNAPCRLWKFEPGREAGTVHVDLSRRPTACFGGLFLVSEYAFVFQSAGYDGQVNDLTGARAFTVRDLTDVTATLWPHDPVRKEDQCTTNCQTSWAAFFDAKSNTVVLCGASFDGWHRNNGETVCVVPPEFAGRLVGDVAVFNDRLVFCTEGPDSLLSCQRETYTHWRCEPVHGVPVSAAACGAQLLVLLHCSCSCGEENIKSVIVDCAHLVAEIPKNTL